MIVDASALVAIVKGEPQAEEILLCLVSTASCISSAATFLEASIVIDALRDPVLSRKLDELFEQVPIDISPVTAEHARIARQAYRDYGRDSGHPANLNFGDCFSYALAAERRQPLLYVGDDFGHTDIRSALAS